MFNISPIFTSYESNLPPEQTTCNLTLSKYSSLLIIHHHWFETSVMSMPVCMYVHSAFKEDPVKQTKPGHRRIERESESLGVREKSGIMSEGGRESGKRKWGRTRNRKDEEIGSAGSDQWCDEKS